MKRPVNIGYCVVLALLSAFLCGCNNNQLSEDINASAAREVKDTAPPVIRSVSPVDNSVDIPVNIGSIEVIFSEDVNVNTLYYRLSISPADVPASFTSYDSATKKAVYSLGGMLNQSSEYTVTVASGVEDIAGNVMAYDYMVKFTTVIRDATVPVVVATDPSHGSADVLPDTPVLEVVFSEQVKESTLAGMVSLMPADSELVFSAYDPVTMKAYYDIKGNLAYSTLYTIVIREGIEDLAGNRSLADSTRSFTTSAYTGAYYFEDLFEGLSPGWGAFGPGTVSPTYNYSSSLDGRSGVLRLSYGAAASKTGVYHLLDNINPTYVRFWMNIDVPAGGYGKLTLFDGSTRGISCTMPSSGPPNTIYLNDMKTLGTGISTPLSQWVKVELKIHWLAQTYDVMVNDAVTNTDVPFAGIMIRLTRMEVTGSVPGASDIWFDDIIMY